MHVTTIIPIMPRVTFQVHMVPTVSPTMPPVQVQRVNLKSPGVKTIPSRKSLSLQPVRPILKPWIHNPRLWHTRAVTVAQLVIQEQINNTYHSVTGQSKSYDKIKLWHTKCWITSMSNELVQLDSGVGDRIKSGIETIFLSTNIKYLQEGRQHISIQSVIIDY